MSGRTDNFDRHQSTFYSMSCNIVFVDDGCQIYKRHPLFSPLRREVLSSVLCGEEGNVCSVSVFVIVIKIFSVFFEDF